MEVKLSPEEVVSILYKYFKSKGYKATNFKADIQAEFSQYKGMKTKLRGIVCDIEKENKYYEKD